MALQKLHISKTGILALFTSFGTLLCCAVPILFVILGLGAALATIKMELPFLVTLTANKGWAFVVSGFFVALATYLTYRQGKTCPADPELAKICTTAQKWNKRILTVTVIIWVVGYFTAYLLLPVTRLFEG